LLPSLCLANGVWSENNKALLLSQQGFFFVDKRIEISNFDMVRDLMKVIELLNE
jgi:hypothetical protein